MLDEPFFRDHLQLPVAPSRPAPLYSRSCRNRKKSNPPDLSSFRRNCEPLHPSAHLRSSLSTPSRKWRPCVPGPTAPIRIREKSGDPPDRSQHVTAIGNAKDEFRTSKSSAPLPSNIHHSSNLHSHNV